MHHIDTVRFAAPMPATGYDDDTPVWVTYLPDTMQAARTPDGQMRRWGDDIEGGGVLAWRAEHGDAAALPYVAPPPPRATVPKSVVQARIIAAGKMNDAYAMLTGNPVAFARWYAPDCPNVYCDDTDAVAFVQALGLDPAAILAPADG